MKAIKRPVKDEVYMTRSGLKRYTGKDRNKGYQFSPLGKGERTIYYTEDEIKEGAIYKAIEQGQVVNTGKGRLQYIGYDKKRAKYQFQDSKGDTTDCTIKDLKTGSNASEKEEKYEDFGRKARGARKDLYSNRNLDDMTPQEREKLVVKSKILKKPDFESMEDRELAGIQYMVWKALPSRPFDDSIEGQNTFIEYLVKVWGIASQWTKYEDANRDSIRKELVKTDLIEVRQDYSGNYYRGKRVPQKVYSKLIEAFNDMRDKDRFTAKLDRIYFQKDKSDKKLEDYFIAKNPPIKPYKNWPSFEARTRKWIATVIIPRDMPVPPEEERENLWVCARIVKGHVKALTLTAKSEEEARNICIEDYNMRHNITGGQGKKTTLVWKLRGMERITNEDSIIRKGDAKGEDYLNHFGLSGEFGNWIGDSERRESMNGAYDAFNDLAQALRVKPKTISYNGVLVVAFGSRGKGKAMAHYEPATNVINLTKFKGAGCVSHEWFHGFDYNIGQKAGCRISFTNSYERDKYSVPEPVRDLLNSLKYNPDGKYTKFYLDAKEIDKGYTGYWSSLVEMFARAGDSFVKDELKSMGMRNDYLCGKAQYDINSDGVAINPKGEEAKRINEKYRRMIAYCKEMGWIE